MARKLRIAHFTVQPVLVWDDETELTPGPEVRPVALSASQIQSFLDALPEEVAALEAAAQTNDEFEQQIT